MVAMSNNVLNTNYNKNDRIKNYINKLFNEKSKIDDLKNKFFVLDEDNRKPTRQRRLKWVDNMKIN
jgi:hypothetical protein